MKTEGGKIRTLKGTFLRDYSPSSPPLNLSYWQSPDYTHPFGKYAKETP